MMDREFRARSATGGASGRGASGMFCAAYGKALFRGPESPIAAPGTPFPKAADRPARPEVSRPARWPPRWDEYWIATVVTRGSVGRRRRAAPARPGRVLGSVRSAVGDALATGTRHGRLLP
ncbi:hypothetical protein Sru01_12340 [Sphaerisporangium rufum]|uniref:Uncharacterized protein n=1 Tax=Sphaerisporangium rufum TaxID=1381558 RepID=A0A919R3A7_9ACTN|nr:hypothetical protein Sru01_12340 [Sphaerisporangium rufum]